MYDNKDDKNIMLDGAPACNICGDKDHTSKEHEGQCPNCEEEHPVGQCPTSQTTCYLCEVSDHTPNQCPIYAMVEQRKQEGSKSTKGKGPLIPPNKTTQFKGSKKPKKPRPDMNLVQCRKFKEMGHYSSECPENKKNKEIYQVWCNNCKELGHYVATCPQEPRKELKDIHCFNCKNPGHYASNCLEKMKNKLNKPMEKLNLGP